MYLPLAHLSTAPLMVADLKDSVGGGHKRLQGHVMFAGEKMVLFYEHAVGTHLLRLEDIQSLEQCSHGTSDFLAANEDEHASCK
jgi:hypothetical protein